MIAAELGKWYRDAETGFSGKCTSILFQLHSTDMAFLEAVHTTRWVEITRLTEVQKPIWL